MTSELELETRRLADAHMKRNPGVGRVTAKNRMRPLARVSSAMREIEEKAKELDRTPVRMSTYLDHGRS